MRYLQTLSSPPKKLIKGNRLKSTRKIKNKMNSFIIEIENLFHITKKNFLAQPLSSCAKKTKNFIIYKLNTLNKQNHQTTHRSTMQIFILKQRFLNGKFLFF